MLSEADLGIFKRALQVSNFLHFSTSMDDHLSEYCIHQTKIIQSFSLANLKFPWPLVPHSAKFAAWGWHASVKNVVPP